MIIFQKFKKISLRFYNSWLFFCASDALEVAQFWRKKGMKIGENTYIYKSVKFGRGGKDPIIIGKNCVLTGCTILGHDASTNRGLGLLEYEGSPIRPVIIEDDCFIGYNAIILMGSKIGKGSIVGAGAVVSSDVPPGSVVAGNPARVISTVDELIERRKRLATEHPEYFPCKPRILDKT